MPHSGTGRWLICPPTTGAWHRRCRLAPIVTRCVSALICRRLREAAGCLPGFNRPALVVWASEDRVMPPEHGRRLAEIIPNARYAEIDDAYVLLPLDQPERVADHLTAFANSLA